MFELKTIKTNHTSFQVKKKSRKRTTSVFEGIETSDQLTGIEIRLNRVFVIDNKTGAITIGKKKIFPGYAKVYFLTIVASDSKNNLAKIDIRAFPKVDDKEDLPVDKTLFLWKETKTNRESPTQIHVFASVIKSKKSLRNAGKILQQVKKDPEYKSVIKDLAGALVKSTPVGQVVDSIATMANVVGGFLGKVEDKPLVSVLQSYTDINGDFDNLGKTSKEFKSKHALLGLSITIRDSSREAIATQS